MHIGILTGGGDVPGLNSAMKAVVNRADKNGWKVTGFRRGWAGPFNYNIDDDAGSQHLIWQLGVDDVRKIDRTGGTFLHTSRTKPSRVQVQDLPEFLRSKYKLAQGESTIDGTEHILEVLEHLKIDVLIAIGGDDTLSYASRLHEEGASTMCIPKTMDNDVFGTDYCIGFSTCVNRSSELITRLRTPAGSHERIMVVELFGRNSGESALVTSYLSDADRVLISEVPFEMEKIAELAAQDKKDNPANYAMVLVSEGAHLKGGKIIQSGEADAYGHQKLGGIGQIVSQDIKNITGNNVMYQSLNYLMRAGAPDAMDLMVGKNFGTMAMQLIEEKKTGLMMAIQDGQYTTEPANISTQGVRNVDVDMFYDSKEYRPRVGRVLGQPMFLK